MTIEEYCKEFEEKIQSAYTEAVTLAEAETLAGQFLTAQMRISDEIRNADLDARMRRSGLKAVRAAVYMEEATKGDKKPSDVMLAALVDRDKLVQGEQEAFDKAECSRDNLERYYNIFREAHVFFRGVSRGRFE